MSADHSPKHANIFCFTQRPALEGRTQKKYLPPEPPFIPRHPPFPHLTPESSVPSCPLLSFEDGPQNFLFPSFVFPLHLPALRYAFFPYFLPLLGRDRVANSLCGLLRPLDRIFLFSFSFTCAEPCWHRISISGSWTGGHAIPSICAYSSLIKLTSPLREKIFLEPILNCVWGLVFGFFCALIAFFGFMW